LDARTPAYQKPCSGETKERGKPNVDRLRPAAYGCTIVVLLVSVCCMALVLTQATPTLDAWWEEISPHLAQTAEEELVYFAWNDYPYLPGDVILSEELKAMASAYGFEEYDIQALIAGAARYDIRWGDVLAIQMNARWEGGFVNMFILSLSIAKFLDEHGYNDEPPPCPTPTVSETPAETPEPPGCVTVDPRLQAIMDLNPAGGAEWLSRVLATSAAWEGPLHTAEILPIDLEDPFDLVTVYTELLAYQTIGYRSELVLVNGQPVILSGSGEVIPYPLPISGFFAHPLPGSRRTGYCFGCPVYNDAGVLIRAHHPGVDLGGTGEAPVYAAHSGEVIYAAWMNSGTLWISGIVVAIRGTYPDGTQVCTLYGHGKTGTLRVSRGDSVEAGDQLMNADSTGFSSGTHLHFDLRFGEGEFCAVSVDPMPFLP